MVMWEMKLLEQQMLMNVALDEQQQREEMIETKIIEYIYRENLIILLYIQLMM
jgi:hypothetical protein